VDQMLFQIQGPARALLTGERTALNFLQLLSGTATAAHAYAERIEGTGCRLLDTARPFRGCARRRSMRCASAGATIIGSGSSTES